MSQAPSSSPSTPGSDVPNALPAPTYVSDPTLFGFPAQPEGVKAGDPTPAPPHPVTENRRQNSSTPTTVRDSASEADEEETARRDTLAEVVRAFQATLHQSVLQTDMVSSASALAHTAQQLLEARQADAASQRIECEVLYRQLQDAERKVSAVIQQLQKEREEQSPLSASSSSCVKVAAAIEQGGGEEEDSELALSDAAVVPPQELWTHYMAARGQIAHWKGELRRSQAAAQQLRSVAAHVVEENTQLREALTTLKLESVPLQQWDTEVRAHQETRFQLEQLRVQLQHVEAASESLWDEQRRRHHQQELILQRYQQQLEQQCASPPSPPTTLQDGSESLPLVGVAKWAMPALEELEAKAKGLADQEVLLAQKRELEEQVATLTAANVELDEALQQRDAAHRCLAVDAQQLTFRNVILSQQVVSLLVKVDTLERRAPPQGSPLPAASPQTKATATPRGALAACMAHAMQLQKPSVLRSSSQPFTRSSTSHRRGSGVHLCGPSPLDVLLAPMEFSKTPTTALPCIEVRRGLAQQLQVYQQQEESASKLDLSTPLANTTRQRVLRRLQGAEAPLAISRSRVPCLPACDQLTGVALSRPTPHCVLNPLDNTVTALGDRVSPTTLLNVTAENEEGAQDFSTETDSDSTYYPVDRYSVQSVEDLVKRNQELLQQLYTLTQSTQRRNSPQRPRTSTQDGDEGSTAAAVRTTGQNCREEEVEQQERRRSSRNVTTSKKASISPRNSSVAMEPASIEGSSEEARLHQQLVALTVKEHAVASEAMREQALSAKLLDVLKHVQQQQHVTSHRIETLGGKEMQAEVVMASLVDLCCSQAVQLAQKAMTETREVVQQQQHDDEEFQAAHEQVLQRLLTDLRQSLLNSCGARNAPMSGPSSRSPTQQAQSSPQVLPETHVELLQQFLHLLETSTQRDETLQQVLRLTEERRAQDAVEQKASKRRRHHKRVREGLRAAAKTSKRFKSEAATAPRTPPQRFSPLGGGLPQTSSSGLSPLPPTTATETCGGATSRSSSRSPSTSSSSLSSSSVEPQSRLDEDEHSVWALKEQLALSHAEHEAVARELEAEKNQHLDLLEQMWRLELERDDAVQKATSLEEAMELRTVGKEVHQSLVEAHDALQSQCTALETSLARLHAELADQKTRFEEEVRRLQESIELEALKHQEGAAQMEAKLHEKEAALAEEHEKLSVLAQQEDTLQQQCLTWQQRSAEQNANAVALEKQVHGLEAKLERTKLEFLSQESIQQVLEHWVDHHASTAHTEEGTSSKVAGNAELAYATNAQLVRDMRGERERLRRQIAHDKLYIQRLEDTERDLQAQLEASRRQVHTLQMDLVEMHQQLRFQDDSRAHNAGEGEDTVEPPRETSRCLEELQRLREQEAGWKAREQHLRDQLLRMSKDPVSASARRFGLAACMSWEQQLQALHQRNAELQASLERLEAAKVEVDHALETARRAHAEISESRRTLQKELETLRAAQDRTQEELQGTTTGLAEARTALGAAQTRVTELEQQLEELGAAHAQTSAQLEGTVQDNKALVQELTVLQSHLRTAQQKEADALEKLQLAEDATRQLREEVNAVHEQLQSSGALRSDGRGRRSPHRRRRPSREKGLRSASVMPITSAFRNIND